jgi:tetraacyldisaccharide 4'-kinase
LEIAGNQKLYFTNIEFDEFIYSEKAVRKVKDIANTDKLLVAGIAKPHFFLDIYRLQMMYVWFSDHHHFSEKDILDIKNKSLKRSLPLRRIICDYRKNTL